MEMGVALLPSDSLAKFLLPVSKTLCSAGPEVLFPKGGMLPLEDTVVMPLNRKLKLPLTFWALYVSESKKGVTVLSGEVDCDYSEETG